MTFDRPFPTPLKIEIAGAAYIVGSAREAAWLLAEKWPDPCCSKLREVLYACAAAIEGNISSSRASLALTKAARAVGIAVKFDLPGHAAISNPDALAR